MAAFAGAVEDILAAFDCSATVLCRDTQVQGVKTWRSGRSSWTRSAAAARRTSAWLVLHAGKVVLTGRVPGPVATLAPPSVPDGDAVTVAATGRRAEIQWVAVAASKSVCVKHPDARRSPPAEPKRLSPLPAAFTAALHAAGRTTSRQGSLPCGRGSFEIGTVFPKTL